MKNLDQFRATFPSPQQRMDKLVPRIEEARNRLGALTPAELVERSGCALAADGRYQLDFAGRAYTIDQAFVVRRADTGDEAPAFIQSIILMYLATADGTPPFEHWISFHELPDGQFYEQAFRGYSGEELIRGLHGDVDAFKRAAEILHGEAIGLGDAAFAFRVLPRLQIAVVMYAGDEDFPAQARVLFEATAPHYLSTDGLAILGGQLVGQIIKAARP
ncbi:MAG: DUF3786 domain-containing protein [Thermoflexales bacterium]|nr:DUF3786 domain-containing protein [Thermoflexales bacterium]